MTIKFVKYKENTITQIFKKIKYRSKWKQVYERINFLEKKKREFASIDLVFFEIYDDHINYKKISRDYLGHNKYAYSLEDYACPKKECDLLDQIYKKNLK